MSTIRPEFIRLPSPKENCPYTGYSRTGLYNLCVPCTANGFKPDVPARCDRKRGNSRGIWLIPYDALIAYINALPCEGMKVTTLPAKNTGNGIKAAAKQPNRTADDAAASRSTDHADQISRKGKQRRSPARRSGE